MEAIGREGTIGRRRPAEVGLWAANKGYKMIATPGICENVLGHTTECGRWVGGSRVRIDCSWGAGISEDGLADEAADG